MKTPLASICAALALSVLQQAHADQFGALTRSTCTNALNFLHRDSIVISYCSQCGGDFVEVWRVKQAFASDLLVEDQFQVTLFAKKLFRSKMILSPTEAKRPVQFTRLASGENSLVVEGVDLAYLYVQMPDGSFHVLADSMNLTPLHCALPAITLPPRILAALAK